MHFDRSRVQVVVGNFDGMVGTRTEDDERSPHLGRDQDVRRAIAAIRLVQYRSTCDQILVPSLSASKWYVHVGSGRLRGHLTTMDLSADFEANGGRNSVESESECENEHVERNGGFRLDGRNRRRSREVGCRCDRVMVIEACMLYPL